MRTCAMKIISWPTNVVMKSVHKIRSTWFYNSTLHIKLMENGSTLKIFHPVGIEKVLGVDNLDEYISNVSYQ